MNSRNHTPLYVDLDGTLILSDCLYESFLGLLRHNPFAVFQVLAWLVKGGRGYMKARIAQRAEIDVSKLPYNQALLTWLRAEKQQGREIILATASHEKYALAIAEYLQLFDRVLATSENLNLKGNNKASQLLKESGEKGFDYAGDSKADLKVWAVAHAAVVVTDSDDFVDEVAASTRVDRRFEQVQRHFVLKALRPHQWLKNVLLFVPLLTSHHLLDPVSLANALIAFIAFSLCASSVYILNDLLDLEVDRQHPRKQNRPFASGRASIIGGIGTMLLLLPGSFLIGAWVGYDFVKWLAVYYVLTLAYSLYLKRVKLLDILLLASLYTIRIVAGAAAIGVPLSSWLLAFSMCFFLSLSLVKRYADLVALRAEGIQGRVPGRQYDPQDTTLILVCGLLSGLLSVIVFARYILSDDVLSLYSHPGLLWVAIPLLMIWVSRVWWAAHRGDIHSDPVLFVVEDRFSQLTLLMLLITVGVAT